MYKTIKAKRHKSMFFNGKFYTYVHKNVIKSIFQKLNKTKIYKSINDKRIKENFIRNKSSTYLNVHMYVYQVEVTL